MLGFHPRLRRDLEKNGQRALAKVREARRTRVAVTTGNAPAEQVANEKVDSAPAFRRRDERRRGAVRRLIPADGLRFLSPVLRRER